MATLEKRTTAELKRLCTNCGIEVSGKKSQIISAINSGLQERSMFQRIPISKKHFNIVSIDMGIRNFSFTRLQLDKTLPLNRPPLIKEWTKFDVNNWADVSTDASYKPNKFAYISHKITNEIIFDPKFDTPDLILIERQRIRSSGGNSVLEWVFRVNMLESMLHALIYSKTVTDDLAKQTIVVSSSPKKMASYWEPSNTGRVKNKDSKKNRLSLVEVWLKRYTSGKSSSIPFSVSDGMIDFSKINETKSTTKWLFQTIMNNSRFNIEPKDSKAAKEAQKGDDLTDSLLHALSWLEWEKQKMILKMELRESVETAIKTSDKMYEAHLNEVDQLLKIEKNEVESKEVQEKKPRKSKSTKKTHEDQ